ncbi:hypothetical protein AUG19_01370 [archaeon 13_1_20CM_2_54_9]|nr:MAG: hypothetical protein AUG19_01370 [archaeon 13_1_20CM_2_54_9]
MLSVRPKPAAIAIIGILILGVALSACLHLVPLPPKTYAATHYITLNGSAAKGWNDTVPGPIINVTENDSVIMTLTSTDTPTPAPHQLYIDTNGNFNPASDCGSGIDKCSMFFGDTHPNPVTYSFNVDLPPGTYTYYCSVHQFMVGTFAVKGFRILSSPNSTAVVRGSSKMSTITLTSVNGFTGTASLSTISSSAGLLTSLNSSSVSLAPGGTSAVSLTVNVNSTTAVGTYNVLVNATIGFISHTTSVAVDVKKPGFSLSPNPAQLVILQGFSKSTRITLTSLNTFNGTVSLSASPQYPGITTAFVPPNVTLNKGLSPAASVLNVTVAPSVIAGEYDLTLTGTGISDTNTTLVKLVVGQDFNLTANPPELTFPQGSFATSRITLASLNGLKGNISLSSGGTPIGLAISFNTTSVNLSPGQTAYASVTISASQSAAPKAYNVTVTGTNSTRVRSVNLSITISGFAIKTSKASFDLMQGSRGNSTITLTSVNGFTGMMNLAVTGSSALTHSLTPSLASLIANKNLTATLVFYANASTGITQPGSYVFNVTGTVGSLSHSTTVTVTVTALPPPPKISGDFPIAVVAGTVVFMVAIVSVILFLTKRRRIKRRNLSVPPTN